MGNPDFAIVDEAFPFISKAGGSAAAVVVAARGAACARTAPSSERQVRRSPLPSPPQMLMTDENPRLRDALRYMVYGR